MVYTLYKIAEALRSIGLDDSHIQKAIEEMDALQAELDGVQIKGRKKIDILLGIMMALDIVRGEIPKDAE